VSERALLRLAGGLLSGGFLLSLFMTPLHPSGEEDNHTVVFAKYADSGGWVAIHLVQFAGVLLALGGFLVLYRLLELRGEARVLARFAAGATIATAPAWAALQAVDGVALKQAVDAWADASGAQKAVRFADAETVRWAEWGINSYFRLLLGLTLVLFGAAIVLTGMVPQWLGWVGGIVGVLYIATGIAVGYSGFENGFGNAAGHATQLLLLIFVIGMLVVGVRSKDLTDAPGHR
jgi:hypothetical protein